MVPSLSGKRLKTAQQYVQETLRAEILQGKIAAGSRLRQDEIAHTLGVSTTPVREALRMLAAEGLVSIYVHRGAFVRELTLDDVREIYGLRVILEPLLLARAFPDISDDIIMQAGEINDELSKTTQIDQWALLNHQFHNVFWQKHLQSRLGLIVENLQTASMPYVALSLHCYQQHIHDSNTIHIDMLAAFQKSDLEKSIELSKAHLKDTLNIIEKSINTV